MVLHTLPPRGPGGRRPAPFPSAATARVLWLVRHGESTWNVLGLAQGQSDQPRLTPTGARQARYAASQLRARPIGVVYASDLHRAVATAAPLAAALGLAITRDPRLRERSLGIVEGTPSAGLPAALSGVEGNRVIDPDACPPDGESLRDLYRRVASFAEDLLARGQPGPPEQVAVIAHGGTVRMLSAYLRGVPVERMSWEPVANGSIVRLPLRQLQRAYSGERKHQ
jgi:2,3-bisphosphoglycerate-dependent phosphoglycerate mutase